MLLALTKEAHKRNSQHGGYDVTPCTRHIYGKFKNLVWGLSNWKLTLRRYLKQHGSSIKPKEKTDDKEIDKEVSSVKKN